MVKHTNYILQLQTVPTEASRMSGLSHTQLTLSVILVSCFKTATSRKGEARIFPVRALCSHPQACKEQDGNGGGAGGSKADKAKKSRVKGGGDHTRNQRPRFTELLSVLRRSLSPWNSSQAMQGSSSLEKGARPSRSE